MKKYVSIFLALLLLIAIPCEAFAENDFSAMSDEELRELFDAARNELASRSLKAEADTVLFDQGGVQAYLTGKYEINDYGDTVELDLEVVILNDSDHELYLDCDGSTVNGWEVMGWGISGISAGKKKKDNIELTISDASISTYEEVEDIEFVFTLFDAITYDVIDSIDPVIVFFGE